MKFSLISDMHLDHSQPKTPYSLLEKNVVVAGDTMNGLKGFNYLDKIKNKGFNVLATHGNHEHYLNTITKRTLLETEERFIKEYPPVNKIEDVPVIMANGWYYVADPELWFNYMNDGRYIVGDTPEKSAQIVNEAMSRDAHFLRTELEKVDKAVVVTHTAPCEDTLDPYYVGSKGNAFYWSPMSHAILQDFKDKILVWCHGHTHAFADKIVEGVRVVCNPRGYTGENPEWKPLTVEVN